MAARSGLTKPFHVALCQGTAFSRAAKPGDVQRALAPDGPFLARAKAQAPFWYVCAARLKQAAEKVGTADPSRPEGRSG